MITIEEKIRYMKNELKSSKDRATYFISILADAIVPFNKLSERFISRHETTELYNNYTAIKDGVTAQLTSLTDIVFLLYHVDFDLTTLELMCEKDGAVLLKNNTISLREKIDNFLINIYELKGVYDEKDMYPEIVTITRQAADAGIKSLNDYFVKIHIYLGLIEDFCDSIDVVPAVENKPE